MHTNGKRPWTSRCNPLSQWVHESLFRGRKIDIQWHFVRDQVETGAVKFEWVPTGDMAADGLIKALINDKFATFVRQIGLKKSE